MALSSINDRNAARTPQQPNKLFWVLVAFWFGFCWLWFVKYINADCPHVQSLNIQPSASPAVGIDPFEESDGTIESLHIEEN